MTFGGVNMFESDWLDRVPNNRTLEGWIEFLNELSWNIHLRKGNGQQWKAFSGDRLLVATNTQEELEAFILGMAIAFAALPDSILEEIKKLVSD